MRGDILEHAVQQADFERAMIGNADMMFASALSGHLNVGACLPASYVAQMPEGAGEFSAVAVPGNLHAASTSSRT